VILADAGPLIAAANDADKHHVACARFVEANADQLLVPSLVVTEVCYLLGRYGGAEVQARFLDSLADGPLTLVELTAQDLRRAAQLVRTYHDLPLDVSDASVVAVAERLNISSVLTLDIADFSVVRPKHLDAFELLP
jgi:uncharacterized protein